MIFRKMKKLLIVLAILFSLVFIYWLIPFSIYKNNFIKDINSKLSNTESTNEICKREEIDKLPEALKKHLNYIGLEGTKKFNAVNVNFHNADFLFDTKKNQLLNIDYDVWLLCDKPFRNAYIESKFNGINFDGVDYMEEDKSGGMKGYIGKLIKIFDINDSQMYKAGLISWLAEGATVNPSILLSEYVSFEEIDSKNIKARVSYNGVQGEGIFTFNENGILEKFESDERQVEDVNGVKIALGWKVLYKNFEDYDNLKVAKSIDVVKIYKDKEVVYFSSNDYKIKWLK